MRFLRHTIRPFNISRTRCGHKRCLLTLAIETSCDDTSVAVLEKHKNHSATLHFHEKITSDNREYKGVYPIVAHESHQKHLANLVNKALQSLPLPGLEAGNLGNAVYIRTRNGGELRKKPDFVTATRGPGMRAGLITGVDTAKGLAVGWQVPFLGVNHMQAHALTPRLVSALEGHTDVEGGPTFPFLSLLVSGGNTMLVNSKGLCDHEILAQTADLAVGDMIDKCARDILPSKVLNASPDVSYGPVLEHYAFPTSQDYNYSPLGNKGGKRSTQAVSEGGIGSIPVGWSLALPMSSGTSGDAQTLKAKYSFSGIGSAVRRILKDNPTMDDSERRILARETMRVAFEHLASRVIMALGDRDMLDVSALVVSGGVASNRYLTHIVRAVLDHNGFKDLPLRFPPLQFCTDNAAMIAWTGIEMWEDGYRTELDAMAMRDWSIDPKSTEPVGILGTTGWRREIVVP